MLQCDKSMYDKLTVNIILNSERLKVILENQKQDIMPTLTMFIQNGIEKP